MASSSNNRQPTANRGGSSSIATPANSGEIGLFGGKTVSPAHGAEPTAEPKKSSAGSGGTRRQSQDGGSMFGNLSNLKRDSQDQGTAQRKGSLSDQKPAASMIGQMWDNFTKGSK